MKNGKGFSDVLLYVIHGILFCIEGFFLQVSKTQTQIDLRKGIFVA